VLERASSAIELYQRRARTGLPSDASPALSQSVLVCSGAKAPRHLDRTREIALRP
jgi:hypothetical protein